MSTDPINSRAWCFQERLLTRRALIYSETLQYACVSQPPFNVGSATNAMFRDTVRLDPFMFRTGDSHPTPSLSSDEEIALRNSWNSVLAEYTRRDLSDPNDKLVALGGVAEDFQRFWKDSTYLAGLWRHNLLEDLLWSANDASALQTRYGDDERDKDKEIHRAPTWSWASVRGMVGAAERMNLLWPTKCRYLCEIVRCETSLQRAINPYGTVTGGTLELNAMLKEVVWNPISAMLFLVGKDGARILISRYASRDCDEEASRNEGVFWAIPIRRCIGGGFNSIEGILVIPNADATDIYRRVGSFTIGTGRVIAGFDPQTWLDGIVRQVTIV